LGGDEIGEEFAEGPGVLGPAGEAAEAMGVLIAGGATGFAGDEPGLAGGEADLLGEGGEGGKVDLGGGLVLIEGEDAEDAVTGAGGEGGEVGRVEDLAGVLEFGGGEELDAEALGGEGGEGPADGLDGGFKEVSEARDERRAENVESLGPEDEGAGTIVEAAGSGVGDGREEFVVERLIAVVEEIPELAAQMIRALVLRG